MLARASRLVLLLELALYAVIGHGLVRADGYAPAQAAGAMLLVALGVRAWVIGVTFVVARIWRTPAPEGSQLGWLAALGMVLEEYLAFVVVFSVVQPFEHFFMGAERLRSTPGRPPLLLIHGYECNRGFWWWLRRRLERAGWCVATINLEPVFAGIDDYADAMAGRIDQVCAATGAAQVILVGHSMGGLVARAYLRRFGPGRIARLVTLGSPHHGSRMAALAWGRNGSQMRIDSAWLREINRPGAVPLPAGSVSLYSCHDNYVMPQSSPVLDGARNVPLAGVGHLTMAFDPVVARMLAAELEGDATDPKRR